MKTKAIIHLDRFVNNFRAVRARVGDRHICVPIKADAYGHGALQIAKASIDAGAFCLGVATAEEGSELRKGGISAPILLMSQSHEREIPTIIEADLTPFVSDAEFISALNDKLQGSQRLPVHLKIDTGMGRLGCSVEESLALARLIDSCASLELAGTVTHFAVSDSSAPEDITYTQAQTARFKRAIDAIREAGIEPGIVHAANSGAVILHPDTWFDMVRPGIFLYGYKTAQESEVSGFSFEPLMAEPVMELRTTVVLIKKIKKGGSVSYGRTWTAAQDTNIAVIAAGYADGLPRLTSGKWQVAIGGNVYPIAGRICMDQCCVDLGSQTNVRRWDEAVIFGGAAHDAAELASRIGMIPYEITCNVSKRVPRVYC